MPSRILVAYLSKKGSTAEIAGVIAAELGRAHFFVDTAAMEEVTSLDDYNAVILGVPVYTGRIMGELALFAGRNREALSRIPVAGFVVGIAPVFPQAGDAGTFTGQFRAALQPVTPVDVTMFAGVLDAKKLSFVERGLTSLLKVPTGDFRNQDAIAAWARGLTEKMGLFT